MEKVDTSAAFPAPTWGEVLGLQPAGADRLLGISRELCNVAFLSLHQEVPYGLQALH